MIFFRVLLKRRAVAVGLGVMAVLALIALFAPFIARFDAEEIAVVDRLQPPSRKHWLGTDDVGRDLYSRLIYGTRLSLTIGISVALATSIFGIPIGILAAYYRRLDNLLMRIMDGLMAFPGLLLGIAIMAAVGPRVINVVIALSIVYVPRMARVVRGVALQAKEEQFVEAARAVGARDLTILVRHIFPQCLSPVIVQATFIFGYSVLGEAALSFLGVGAPPHVPSWGNILSQGRPFIYQAPWLTTFPGVAISMTILCLNLVGDGLRDALDPRIQMN